MAKSSARTVLLVDDYPAGLLVGTLLIEHLEYKVLAVSSGAEAIEIIRNAHEPFMAVLMDIKMNGLDGFETTAIIRAIEKQKGYSQPIIAVTAHAFAGDRQRCLDAGMNDYISKPIHPELLAQKLAPLATARCAA
ncbi:MAG: response regulator [Alphaproteobacteria bacterium]|nr:response regulator [Alphaproteobacteria bacterium]